MNTTSTAEAISLKSQLSNRLTNVKPSATLAVAAKARELKNHGKAIIDLGIGEPDFDTPDHIKAAGITAIQEGFTKYTPIQGTLDLRKAIATKLQRDNQLQYDPNQILVSCGCKQSLYNLTQALLNPNDEVIIPAPYWTSYPEMVSLTGAIPKIISAGMEQNFKITAAQLKAAINPKTKLIILNSPSNPSGMAYSRSELEAIGQVLESYPNTIIATDDIYEEILWSKEPFCNILMACPKLYDRTVVFNGVSKTYAMTGWRIGYAAGPKVLLDAMSMIQGQSTSGACSISQKAAQMAIEGDQACVKPMVQAFKARHDYLVNALNEINGFQCARSDGTFYAFPNVEKAIKNLPSVSNDTELADFLLNKALIATVPGGGFGTPGHIRLSFATSMENLEKAINALKQIFN